MDKALANTPAVFDILECIAKGHRKAIECFEATHRQQQQQSRPRVPAISQPLVAGHYERRNFIYNN